MFNAVNAAFASALAASAANNSSSNTSTTTVPSSSTSTSSGLNNNGLETKSEFKQEIIDSQNGIYNSSTNTNWAEHLPLLGGYTLDSNGGTGPNAAAAAYMYDQNSAFNAAVGNNYLPAQYGYGMLPSDPFVAVAAAGRNDQLLTMMSGQSTMNGMPSDSNEKESDLDKNG